MAGNPLKYPKEERNQTAPYFYTWRFRFGLYKGKAPAEVPTSYLIWLRRNCSILAIQERCSDEIERRQRLAKPVVLNNSTVEVLRNST